jgi:hypothetical protein
VETTLHLHNTIEDHVQAIDAGPIHVGRQRIGDSVDAVVIRVGGSATGQLTILGSLAQAQRFAAELSTQLDSIEAARS